MNKKQQEKRSLEKKHLNENIYRLRVAYKLAIAGDGNNVSNIKKKLTKAVNTYNNKFNGNIDILPRAITKAKPNVKPVAHAKTPVAKPAKPTKALREAINVATQLLGLGTPASVKSLGHGALTLAFVNEALVVAIGDHGAMIDRHEVLALYTWLRAHCDSHVVGK